MAGGILQLVSTGNEDIFISGNPHVTMFKTVYRRHVNFDKTEQELTFNSDLNFDSESTCKIKKNGDLISALSLLIELPKIDISYIPLTNYQLASFLSKYDIIWEYDDENSDNLITQSEFEQVVGKIIYDSGKMIRLTNGMINDKIDNLTKTIEKDDAFVETINTITSKYKTNNNTNVNEYINELMLELFRTNRELFLSDSEYIDNYDYFNEYYYLYSFLNDLSSLIPQYVSWQDGTGTMHRIISFYDPTIGLPIPTFEDRYISSRSDRGWIEAYIYRYYDESMIGENNWYGLKPEQGFGAHLQKGFTGMTPTMLKESVGFNKTVIGLYDPYITNDYPQNPQIDDKYICKQTFGYWKTNNIYEWDGYQWNETIPSAGNSLFVSGQDDINYYLHLIYFDSSDWIIYEPEIIVIYDGFQPRKSVYCFYDPTLSLPTIIIPDSIGITYICSKTANGWTENNLYIWDGWEWIEKIPTKNYGVYVENGDINSNKMIIYNGTKWNVLILDLPLVNYYQFRKIVSDELQNIIFTDENIKMLYGTENCNTKVIPTTSIQPIRTFFDNIITNTIGTINTNTAIYKSVYNDFFDDSQVGSLEHVLIVQETLSQAMRNEIINIINPNIQMLTLLYNRLRYVDAAIPDYYRFCYFKWYPYSGTYDNTKTIMNCPREYYDTNNSLIDYYSSHLLDITNDTDYIQFIKNNVYALVGNQSTSSNGSLYNVLMNMNIQSFFNNFFTNTSPNYESVLDCIVFDPLGEAGQRKMYNLTGCLNILTSDIIGKSVKYDLAQTLYDYCDVLENKYGTRGITWSGEISNLINYILNTILATENIQFPANLWNTTDGFLSHMTQNVTSLDRLVSFIFMFYVKYDVYKVMPAENTFVPNFIIYNKNPIEYVVLTFVENLVRYITYRNNLIDNDKKWTSSELQLVTSQIEHIGNAYLDVGLTNYSHFSIHDTNISDVIIPELFVTSFTTHHLPFDGITSVTCYLLNQMITIFNDHYQTNTTQTIYDEMGDPFMTANDQFVTSNDFYTYGNDMYNKSVNLINALINTYTEDIEKYDKYGKLLNIKNLFLTETKYLYTYPIKMYVEIHKEIYTNQVKYINETLSDYDDTYTNILQKLDERMLPLLKYLNPTNQIYMSPIDTLIVSLNNRLTDLMTNPYDDEDDTIRYAWYNEKIIQNVLNVEVDFDPETVGIMEFFMSSINSLNNPFEINTNLYEWYNGLDHDKISFETDKMYYLFGLPYYSTNDATTRAITPQSLEGDIGNINSKYNSFTDISDFIRYMMNHIIIFSQLGSIVSLFKATIDATNLELINYYENERSYSKDMIDKINPYTLENTNLDTAVRYSELEDIIRNIYGQKNVNFAWIKEIGHYLIDRVQLLIDDVVIDQYNGEYMSIVHRLEGSDEQENGYSKMIGNIPQLTTFNNTIKPAYKLFIPIYFTFSKFYEAALPLICLQFSNVSIRVKLKSLSDVAYWTPLTIFNKNPKLKCLMLADYIYIDHEERIKMAPLKQEMLMETIQYNGDVMIDLSTTSEISVRLNMIGLSKELYIVCRLDEYIDGTLPNGEKKWNYYLVDIPDRETKNDIGLIETTYLHVNPIYTIQIKYNGRERETTKNVLFYTCIQKYEHHRNNNYDGINVYSYALTPELLQPSGNANLGKIGNVDLVIKFRDDVMNLVGKNKKIMHINVYNKSSNILRMMSGIGGLAFCN